MTDSSKNRQAEGRESRCALVTGGGGGIGRAIAAELVREGWRTMICGRDEERLAAAAAEIGAEAAPRCDVRSPADVNDLYSHVNENWGRLDLLVNNAGVGRFLSIEETSEEDWAEMIGTNLGGTWRMSKAALPLLLASRGAVVNICSIASRHAFAGNSAYCAAKFGQLGFAEAMREEYRVRGLRVLNVLPGATDTSFWTGQAGDWDRERMIRPETVAEAVMAVLRLPAEALAEEIVVGPAAGPL